MYRHCEYLCDLHSVCVFFFFNDTATTEIYTLSLHDALPIFAEREQRVLDGLVLAPCDRSAIWLGKGLSVLAFLVLAEAIARSEEHTSELQSRQYLVCRLLLEKKKKIRVYHYPEKSMYYIEDT